MHTVMTQLHRDFSRDNYWTKVELVSDKQNRKTNIMLCASYEYLSQYLKTEDLNDQVVGTWIGTVVEDIQKKGEVLFDEPNHLEVRAITQDGYQNGIDFLKERILEIKL